MADQKTPRRGCPSLGVSAANGRQNNRSASYFVAFQELGGAHCSSTSPCARSCTTNTASARPGSPFQRSTSLETRTERSRSSSTATPCYRTPGVALLEEGERRG